MKINIIPLGVCLLVGVAFSAEEDPATSQKTKADTEDSDLHAEESLRLEIQVQPQTPLETDTPSKVTKGQLSTATAEQDASFHLDSRGGITNIQGAVPKDDLIETHEKLSEKFQDAIDKSHLTYSADNQYDQVSTTAHQWAYKVLAPSTGDYQSQVEHRQEDGVVRGRYSLIQPDGSLRVVNYIAHPEDGFQATVQNQPISTSSTFTQHQYNQAQRQNTEQLTTQINQEQKQRLQYQDFQRQQQFDQRQQQFNQQQQRFDQQHQQFDRQQQQFNQRQEQFDQRQQNSEYYQQNLQRQQHFTQRQQQFDQRQQQFTTNQDRIAINTPTRSNFNQGQQFWMKHPLYARVNTPRLTTQYTPSSWHQLTPSAQIIPSHFQPAQHKFRSILLRPTTSVTNYLV